MDPRLLLILKTHYRLEAVQLLQRFATNGQREAYLLQTEQGQLVLKVSDPGRPEAVVQSDTGILEDIARFNFPAPLPFPSRDQRLYLPFDERFIYLYRFIPGQKPRPSAQMLANCGALLAHLHSLPLEQPARISRHRPQHLLDEVRANLQSTATTAAQQAMAEEIQSMLAVFPSFEALPEGLIHTDPYFVNLLEGQDGRLYLIDWEDAGISYPLIDVGYVGHLCTYLPQDRANLGLEQSSEAITWRPDWIQAFLDGYQAVHPLSPAEKTLFPFAVQLNFLMYIWDWDQARIIPENYQRMKLLEQFTPNWA